MDPDRIDTAFMLELVGDPEQVDRLLKGRPIFAVLPCPQPDGSIAWSTSVVPIGVIDSYATKPHESTVKVTMMLLRGEADKI